MGVIVRRAEVDDWQICRDIRLRALREEPQAYESTLEDEQHLSDRAMARPAYPRLDLSRC